MFKPDIKLPFRKKLFGNNIEPKCEYCRFGRIKDDGTVLCYSGSTPQEGGCKRFKYDPLKREPTKLPPLKKYSPEDFML